MATPIVNDIVQNSCFASRKGDPFIRRWHELFVHIWSTPPTRTNCIGVRDGPLLKFLDDVPYPVPPIGLKVSSRTFEEYTAQILCWRRICRLSVPDKGEDGFDSNKYWMENIMHLSMVQECWGAEEICGLYNPITIRERLGPLGK
jgi:hypothetical protein